ncbi:MAG TPA: DUF1345 domain-containing protein [Pseudonocardiaceae bacterium]|nr:DUF1345 domain-containing protein [Pseudonocardiaceae bacterium]
MSGRKPSARTEVIVAALAGLIAAVPVTLHSSLELGLLVGWDTATVVYLTWIWMMIWPRDAEQTAQWAEYTDPTRALADLLVLTAALASLVAVGLVLAHAARSQGAWEVLQVGLSLTSIVLSWAVVHTVFALRYARLYYLGPDGGVDFNDENQPRYSDFAYLAFTVGMTFQVSDTALSSNEIRRTALRHALLSYLFGTGILATAINLVASLSSK